MCVVNDESYTLPYRVMNNKDTLNSIPQASTYFVSKLHTQSPEKVLPSTNEKHFYCIKINHTMKINTRFLRNI